MDITVEYVKERFDYFNALCFDGSLPPVPIKLSNAKTFLGMCAYKKRRTLLGKTVKYDFVLRINTRIDLPEQEVEDTILHEMIHYYIGYNQWTDTSAHGTLFRRIMSDINTRHGRNITISHRITAEQREQALDTRKRWHAVAVVTMADGTTGIKVLPRKASSIVRYHNVARQASAITGVKLYMSCDPFFNRYPCSSSLKVHQVDRDELILHLKDSHDIACDGTTIKVSPRKNE